MRVCLAALVALGALAQAGAAAAQSDMMPMMNNPMAGMAHGQDIGPTTPMMTKRDRYLMKLASLRQKTIKTKARDGGQLTPEHATSLQKELDELNKAFGITAG